MRLKTFEDTEKFIELIKSCQGPVYLTDWKTHEDDKHDFFINLKSTLSMYVGVGKLLEEKADWFEIYCSHREDEEKIMCFIKELNERENN